jgi:large subunit ribosomal protein L54
LNFYKDKQDPVAMADEEYPAWLWKVLDKTSGDAAGAKVDEGDLYGMFSAVLCAREQMLCLV